jgi:hypothetical protein
MAKQTISVRFDPADMEWLRAKAKEERRSVANLIMCATLAALRPAEQT